jgi:hypothetical protein
MLTILAIKDMQINSTLVFHLTPARIATIKNTTNNKFGLEFKGKRNPHTQLVGM